MQPGSPGTLALLHFRAIRATFALSGPLAQENRL